MKLPKIKQPRLGRSKLKYINKYSPYSAGIRRSDTGIAYAHSIGIAVLASILVTYIMFAIQPFEFANLGQIIEYSSWTFVWLNFIPSLAFMLLILFLTNNLILSIFLVYGVVIFLSVVNRFKILLRHDPLFFTDFTLVEELFIILLTFETSFLVYSIMGCILFIIVFAVMLKMIKTKKFPVRIRLPIAGFIGAVIIILNNTVYSDSDLFDRLYVLGSRYNSMDVHNSRGFLLSFIYTTNTNRLRKPDDFSDVEVLAIKASFEQADFAQLATQPRPHIIAIMGEAFSDLPNSDQLIYSVRPNPISFFNNLIEDNIHGTIIVPNVGGGTADTEFDFLTGLNTRFFTGVPYSYRMINTSFPSLASIFRDMGYNSIAIHPGHAWFYNRYNIFQHLGFNFFLHGGFFQSAPLRGGYIAESATIDSIFDIFYENLEQHPGVPLFNFTITIQNHGPYEGKGLGEFEGLQFRTDPNFTAGELDGLHNYLVGLYDADVGIRRLVEHFEHHEEPVVIVYFGDHMPALPFSVLEFLTPEPETELEELTRYHRAPFFIWQNNAAKPLTNIDNYVDSLRDITIGSPYLGALFLEVLGHTHVDPLFYFLNSLRRDTSTVNLAHADFFHGERVEDTDGRIATYRNWNFFRIFSQ